MDNLKTKYDSIFKSFENTRNWCHGIALVCILALSAQCIYVTIDAIQHDNVCKCRYITSLGVMSILMIIIPTYCSVIIRSCSKNYEMVWNAIIRDTKVFRENITDYYSDASLKYKIVKIVCHSAASFVFAILSGICIYLTISANKDIGRCINTYDIIYLGATIAFITLIFTYCSTIVKSYRRDFEMKWNAAIRLKKNKEENEENAYTRYINAQKLCYGITFVLIIFGSVLCLWQTERVIRDIERYMNTYFIIYLAETIAIIITIIVYSSTIVKSYRKEYEMEWIAETMKCQKRKARISIKKTKIERYRSRIANSRIKKS